MSGLLKAAALYTHTSSLSGGNASPWVLTKPATDIDGNPFTVADGDVLILLIKATSTATRFPNTGATSPGAYPSGWADWTPAGIATTNNQSAAANAALSTNAIWAYMKVAGASEPASYDFPFTATNPQAEAVILVLRGADTANPVKAGAQMGSSANSSASARTLPSVTGLAAGDDLVRVFLGTGGATSVTYDVVWPAGLTQVAEGTSAANFISVAHQIRSDSSDSGTAAVTIQDTTAAAQATTYRAIAFAIAAAPASAPSNTVLPAVTGTLAVGQQLTCDNGSWDGSPTSFTRQWKRDGSAISGATAGTYTVVSGDAGHTITCTVTATNVAGSTAATSTGSAIPPAPANTVLPTITTDGTPATGETITGAKGTWTNATSYTIQFYRGNSPISGATGTGNTLDYVLRQTDEGANIKIGVIAHGPGGDSSEAFSDVIVPAVTAPLGDASGLFYYSGGTDNTSPSASIGGARGGTIPAATLNSVFGPIPGSMRQSGGVLYAVLYVRNTHGSTTLPSSKLFVSQQPDNPGLHIDVAVPSQAAGQTVPALASRITAPVGASWTRAPTFDLGDAYGDLGPGAARGIYVRLTIDPGTPVSDDSRFRIDVQSQAA
jgi:hypothetical protein